MPNLNPIRLFNAVRDRIEGRPDAKPSSREQRPRTRTRRPNPDRNQTRPQSQGTARLECRLITPEETHVHQYSNDENVRGLSSSAKQREAQANCGPSSAAIVLGKMDIDPPSLHQLRAAVGAPLGTQNQSYYAITADQLVDMVVETAEDNGLQTSGSIQNLPRSARAAWEELQKGLYIGVPTVLLTGNMSSRGPGHYVVVEKAENGKIYINDPQFEDGANREHDFAEFKAAFERRQRLGRPNLLIRFMPSFRID